MRQCRANLKPVYLDNNNDDPNHNYQILEKSLINSHNECFPTRVVKFNRKSHKISPWMTNGILKSINHRNRLYKNLNPRAPSATYMLQGIHMHIAPHILNKILPYVYVGILHVQLDPYTEKKIIIQHYITVPHE